MQKGHVQVHVHRLNYVTSSNIVPKGQRDIPDYYHIHRVHVDDMHQGLLRTEIVPEQNRSSFLPIQS
jgi:hypothetical protein